MKKHYYLTLDTETTNSLKCPLAYDIGGCIHDRNGVIIERFSFLVTDIFCDTQLMQSAYYQSKIKLYLKMLYRQEIVPMSFAEIHVYICQLIKKYNISRIYAYNASFDRKALNITMRYLTSSRKRYYFPKEIEWHDILKGVRQTIGSQKKYFNFCQENGYMTNHIPKRVRMSAEIVYKYLLQDRKFEEKHMALADCEIEIAIIKACWDKHMRMDCKL